MEPLRRNPHDITPGRPNPVGPSKPTARPVFGDFNMRTARPASMSPQPGPKPQPQPQPQPHASAHLQPQRPVPPAGFRPTGMGVPPKQAMPASALTPRPTATATRPTTGRTPEGKPVTSMQKQKPAEPREKGSRAWLVGLVVFVLLAIFALAPLLPGKILENFPGSSQSFSTGDQDLACATDLSQVQTSQKYNSKIGFPLVYSYATTTTQQALCSGKSQTAVGGHTSQFNPLAGVIDVIAALAIGAGVGKIWALLHRDKH